MYPCEVLPPEELYLNNDGEEAPAAEVQDDKVDASAEVKDYKVDASAEVKDDKVDAAQVPRDDKVDEAEVPTALGKAEVTSDGDLQDGTGVRDGEKGGCDDTAATLGRSSLVE